METTTQIVRMDSRTLQVAEVTVEDKTTNPPSIYSLKIYPDQTFNIGRDPSAHKNHLSCSDPDISRRHLELYSVMFDDEGKHCPLVFVRDKGSLNGTYVNKRMIGNSSSPSPAVLLQDGDIISIGQNLQLKFHQSFVPRQGFAVTSHQRRELAALKKRYVVTDRCIGDGACGRIFLAIDVETGRQVACKVHNLRSSHLASFSRIKRIEQEATLLSYLDHPNVLAFLNAFQTADTIYIFTELATGGDLFSLIHRKEQFSELEIRLVIYQILLALAYLHGKGVAHRDVKPENVLCAVFPGVDERIVLSDFGDAAVGTKGRMFSSVGTTFYRAPECRMPATAYNLSVDIWALGILTLELFADTGAVPEIAVFDPRSQSDMDKYLECVLKDIYPRGQISSNGRDFIYRCLLFDGDQRLSANEALRHPWFRESQEIRAKILQVQQDAFASRPPRRIVSPVIEDISGIIPPAEVGTQTSASPYFPQAHHASALAPQTQAVHRQVAQSPFPSTIMVPASTPSGGQAAGAYPASRTLPAFRSVIGSKRAADSAPLTAALQPGKRQKLL